MAKQRLADKFQLPKRCQGSTEHEVWNEIQKLSKQYQPLNLGYGFTDYSVPKYMSAALAATAQSSNSLLHQYTRGFGHPRLVEALSTLYTKLVGRTIDPLTEILVTSGAYEAIYVSIQGYIDDRDEVIIIEPFFSCYEPMVRMAGGTPRFIPLRLKNISTEDVISTADYVLDEAELEGLFNEKTKMIILNTPNNPLGKVFNRVELTQIANLCIKHNILCISDEVYEWMVYDDNEHIRMCTLPGMWDRTITIGSAGKTFSVTGWKTGWAYGPSHLMKNLQIVHQNCVYTCSTPIQETLAVMIEMELTRLDSPHCYFNSLPVELKHKRDFMMEFLTSVGVRVIKPQGGYFLSADCTIFAQEAAMHSESDLQIDDRLRFTKWMIKSLGIQAIPLSVFYSVANKTASEHVVRFCFYKSDEQLQKAADILKSRVNK